MPEDKPGAPLEANRGWGAGCWPPAPEAPSAAELARQLQVTAKTAWLLRRKIQHAMARGEGELMLQQAAVDFDDVIVGGKEPGSRASEAAVRGRWFW